MNVVAIVVIGFYAAAAAYYAYNVLLKRLYKNSFIKQNTDNVKE